MRRGVLSVLCMRRCARLGAALPLLAVLGALLDAPGAAAAPSDSPDLDARAWVLVDARDGERLAGRAASRQLPVASATKLMTTYLALAELPLDRKLEAPAYSALPAESVLGLRAGEKMTVRDLVVAMMLPSANDAAFTVAEGVSGSVPRFVKRMNGAARKLGLDDTSYANPIGLDDPLNGSSARDLAALTLELREDDRFRRIVAKPEARLESGAQPRTVQTRNTLLLGNGAVNGVKTGHTLGAGYVLVASAKRDGVPLVSVVLGAASESARDAESQRLLDYGFSLYGPRRAVRRGEAVAAVTVEGEDDPLELQAGRGERVTARADQSLAVEAVAPDRLEGPLQVGERVGRGVVTLDGRRVGSVPLVAGRAVAAPGVLDELGAPIAVILIAGGSILVAIAFAIANRRSRGERRSSGVGRTADQRATGRDRRRRRRQEDERT